MTRKSSISIRLAAVAILMASLFGLAGTVQAQNAANTRKGGNLVYHGGAVMINNLNVHLIFAGNWGTSQFPAPGATILTDFAGNLGFSAYYRINSEYGNGVGVPQPFDSGRVDVFFYPPVPSNLTDGDVINIVNTIYGSSLDPNAVYFVLTSADISNSNGPGQFCTNYCAYHNAFPSNGQNIKYAFVGNANRCPSACAPQTNSPNGDAGIDAMALQIALMLSSTVTDPIGNAWFDKDFNEIGLKCPRQFGTTFTAANGSQYNVTLGTRQYLLQELWVNRFNGQAACSLTP